MHNGLLVLRRSRLCVPVPDKLTPRQLRAMWPGDVIIDAVYLHRSKRWAIRNVGARPATPSFRPALYYLAVEGIVYAKGYEVFETDEEALAWTRARACEFHEEGLGYTLILSDTRAVEMPELIAQQAREEYEAWVAEATTPLPEKKPYNFKACGGTFKVTFDAACSWDGSIQEVPNVVLVETDDAQIVIGQDNPRHKGNPRLKRDGGRYILSLREGDTACIRSLDGTRQAYLTVRHGYFLHLSGDDGERLRALPPLKES